MDKTGADPLISFMFRYITRIQDLGTACELAQSLLEFYEGLGDDVAVMKWPACKGFLLRFPGWDPFGRSGERGLCQARYII